MVKITEQQKTKLTELLDDDEIKTLFDDNIADFFTDLHLIMIGYMDEEYNHTEKSYQLQRLYDDIYSQNLE